MSSTLIRIERQPRKRGGPRNVRVYRCQGCGTAEVKYRTLIAKSDETGLCRSCSHRKRPYESIYNSLFNDHREVAVNLSYEEYVEFTKQSTCTYCESVIPWTPYGMVVGEFKSRAYFLDRKDTTKGYSKENCVVCCTSCNRLRSDKFSYDEFRKIGTVLKSIYTERLKGCLDIC